MIQPGISKAQTDIGKAICALIILLHHWEQQADVVYVDFLKYAGGFACIAFFLMSSYGLTKSFITSPNEYVMNFFYRRLCKVFIPFVVANVLYLFFSFYMMDDVDYSILNIVYYIGGVKLLNGHLWFMQALIIQYMGIYVVCRFMQGISLFYRVIVLLIFAAIYILIGGNMGTLSVLGFVVGYIYAYKETTIPNWLMNKFVTWFVFICAILILYLIHYCGVSYFPLYPFSLFLFMVFDYNILARLKSKKMIWGKLSAISFSLYIMNAFALHIYLFLDAKTGLSEIVCFILYMVVNFVFAYFFNCLVKRIQMFIL